MLAGQGASPPARAGYPEVAVRPWLPSERTESEGFGCASTSIGKAEQGLACSGSHRAETRQACTKKTRIVLKNPKENLYNVETRPRSWMEAQYDGITSSH